MNSSTFNKIKKAISARGALVALILMVIVASFAYDTFFTYTNISNVFRQTSMKGIVAIGMTFVILMRGIDLSVGSVVALSGILASSFSSQSVFLMIIFPLFIGMMIGLFNGILVAKLKMAPFIVTLAMMMGVRGVVYIISNEHTMPYGDMATGFSDFINSNFLGVPVLSIIFFLLLFLVMYIARYTSYGRNIYAIGGNEEAANLMGIRVEWIKASGYLISGFCASLGGLLLSARLGSGQPYVASAWELDAIAAVAIGGTSFSGGVGKFSGTCFGVLIAGVISNIINLQGTLSSWWQNIITGMLLLFVVVMQSQFTKTAEKRRVKKLA